MAEERISFDQWAVSDVKETTLKEMVKKGIIPTKKIIGWRPARGEEFPTPNTREIMVFFPFFYSSFGIQTPAFFRSLLRFLWD